MQLLVHLDLISIDMKKHCNSSMYFCRFLMSDNNGKEYAFKCSQYCILLLCNIGYKFYLNSILAAFWRQKAKTEKFNLRYYFSLFIIQMSGNKVHGIFNRNYWRSSLTLEREDHEILGSIMILVVLKTVKTLKVLWCQNVKAKKDFLDAISAVWKSLISTPHLYLLSCVLELMIKLKNW